MQNNHPTRPVGTLLLALTLCSSNAAIAQAPDEDEILEDNPFGIEEVMVTANRRQENIQEVPMSVSAFGDAFFKDSGTTDFTSLEQYTPGLKISPINDSRSTSIRIRGIGSTGDNAGVDPSVGVFIDGVYQGRAGMSVGDLIDIERVEVLRGPQGTLYGKNTAAGAISIISKKPAADLETELELVAGNFNARELRGMINLPFGNSSNAGRFSFYNVERDGMYDNAFLDKEVNDANKWGFKSRFVFDLGNAGELLFSVDRSNEDSNCCSLEVITYDGPSILALDFAKVEDYLVSNGLAAPLPHADPFDGKHYTNTEFVNQTVVEGLSLEWNKTLSSESTLTWIHAHRFYESYSRMDGDFSPYNSSTRDTDVDLSQVSSEIRLASPGGGDWEYQIGLFYYYSEMDTIGTFAMHEDVAPIFDPFETGALLMLMPAFNGNDEAGVINFDNNKHETISYASFGRLTWNYNETWSFSAGLRVTYEKKEREGTQDSTITDFGSAPPIIGPFLYANQDRSETDVSPAFSVRYFPVEKTMLYFSISQGFKSGGFNQMRTNAVPAPEGAAASPFEGVGFVGVDNEFGDERSINAEIGVKSSFMDRRITVNATVFYVDYDEFQAQTWDGATVSIRNAGTLESYGLELDALFFATRDLSIGFAIGYNKAQYEDFPNAECTMAESFAYAEGIGLIPLLANCSKDLAGEPLDSAPEWTFSGYLQYEKPWQNADIKWFSRLEYNYTDDFYLSQDLDENLLNSDSHLVNLRMGFMKLDYTWEVAFWGRNILDEEYFVMGIDIPTMSGYAAVTAPPATYGVSLRYRYN